MSPRPANETPEERKRRERMEFLALPPEEAQRRISLNLREFPMRDVTPPGQDLRSELEPYDDDEMVDK